MDIEDFRKHGHDLIDWIAKYYKNIEQYPVKAHVYPGEIKSQLPENAPEKGESFEHIFKDFEEYLLKGITHWQHPSFHAYFSANASFPSILGELLTSALGAQCMLWETSPSASELEELVTGWLKNALGLPASWSGVIQDTASTGTLCALLAARERQTDFKINQSGFKGDEGFVVYASEEAHSSVEKAVKISGIGSERLRKIEIDRQFALKPEVLRSTLENDLKNGLKPLMVVSAIGTTGSLAVDPLSEIAAICKEYNVWLHVDAAYAGVAAICPEHRWIHEGIENADSYVFNPHKWLLTNFDCSVMYVRDKDNLIKTFEILPEYLKTESQTVNNYKDWGIQLGRRFRALKLWFVMRSYGIEGIQGLIRKHISIAKSFEHMLFDNGEFEILTPVNFTLVCFRYKKPVWSEAKTNEFNEEVLRRINVSGKAYITHTKLNGKYTLRAVFSQSYVEHKHAEKLFNLIMEVVGELTNEDKE